MGRFSRRIAVSLAVVVAFLAGAALATPAVADALKDVRVVDVTQQLAKVNLDQTQGKFTSDPIDVSHAKQIRLDAFVECLTACASDTQLFLTITEVSNNNTYVVDQIVTDRQAFQSKLYETPGQSWTLSIGANPLCQCAVAIVSLFARGS
ncbi:MAG TPA: hypothetical protein VGK28_10835 [Candidatus Dormibacteraeota bacterium]|jgi:hypothetical protein